VRSAPRETQGRRRERRLSAARRALAALSIAAFALLGPSGGVARPAGCDVEDPPPASAFAPLRTDGLVVGLALGSGSMHGLAHIGVIQELEARGVEVKVVAGTSVGAIVGSLWASGVDGREIEGMSRKVNFDDFGNFAASFQGLLGSEALRAPLEAAFRKRPIESWPRRFGAVATNLADGQRRLLVRGDPVTAVQASSAVPVLFLPIVVNGERLADGALVEPVPAEAARDLGANFVIAVDVAYRPDEGEASGITQYAFQAMHILINALARQQLRSADVAIRLNLHHRLMSCGESSLVAAGREAVRRAWPEMLRAAAAARRARP
jgi:NTE family protein